MWFCNTYRSSVKLRHPNILQPDVQKILGLMWRESSPEKKNVFQSLAIEDRIKYQKDLEQYSKPKTKQECSFLPSTPKFLTPAMKKQSFDFNFPPDVILTPEIPELNKCNISEPQWKVVVDDLIFEDLGFDDMCHDNEGKEIFMELENTTRSNAKLKYYEVHVVKTPDTLRNKGYNLEISKEPPRKLFESPESDSENLNEFSDIYGPPVLNRFSNTSIDSSVSDSIDTNLADDVEMPVLEKEDCILNT